MSSSSSSEEDLVIGLICNEVENQKRRFWVHDINKKRKLHGEYHTLFNDLLRDDSKFFKYFRMSCDKFFQLLSMLNLQKMTTNFREPISPEERLAVTLKFLGHGDSFTSLAFSYRLGESTVRSIVYETCEEIWKKLKPHVMPSPTTEQWRKIEEGFNTKWHFPNCVGAIDGKHVVIEKPPNSGTLYFNYKKEFSIVLMALVDADYRFVMVSVGAQGKNSDGGILKSSTLYKRLHNGAMRLPKDKPLPGSSCAVPHVIVGDEAFPLERHLMRPYSGSSIEGDEGKRIYNYRHSRARRISENAFGILCKKFRIFQRKFNIHPKHIDIIVLAATCLHNFLRDDECAWQPGELEADIPTEGLSNFPHIGGNHTRESAAIREHFKNYFISPQGSVPWQREKVYAGRKNLPVLNNQ